MVQIIFSVRDSSGYRPVTKACARMSGKPGPEATPLDLIITL
jgi:hypothetical protein